MILKNIISFILSLLICVSAFGQTANIPCDPDWYNTDIYPSSAISNAPIYSAALMPDGHSVIMGGMFDNVNGQQINNIFVWDYYTHSITPLGAGLSSPVLTVISYNGNIIAGGAFGLKLWNGLVWIDMGLSNVVECLTIIPNTNTLVAGGTFPGKAAIYQNNTWILLPGIESFQVRCLYVDDNNILYAGGTGLVNGSSIAKWNGISWQMVGDGIVGEIYCINSFHNRLLAGGLISQSLTGTPLIAFAIQGLDGNWEQSASTAVGTYGGDDPPQSWSVIKLAEDSFVMAGGFWSVNNEPSTSFITTIRYEPRTIYTGIGPMIRVDPDPNDPTFPTCWSPVNGITYGMLKLPDNKVLLYGTMTIYYVGSNSAIAHFYPFTDMDCSDTVEVQDIFVFLDIWFNGDARSDYNHDGLTSVQDIFDYLNDWFKGK